MEAKADRGAMRKSNFLVIAAPRPSGLPDLERIQAETIRGAFFCGDDLVAYEDGVARPHPDCWSLYQENDA